jgi:hypothetical protein
VPERLKVPALPKTSGVIAWIRPLPSDERVIAVPPDVAANLNESPDGADTKYTTPAVSPEGSDEPPVGKTHTCWLLVYALPGARSVLVDDGAANANADALPRGNIPPNVPLVIADQNPTNCTVVEAGTLIVYGPPDSAIDWDAGEANVTATLAYEPPETSLLPAIE